MEALLILAVIAGLLSSISKAVQKRTGASPRPRVTEARAPEEESTEQPKAVHHVMHQVPHVPLRDMPFKAASAVNAPNKAGQPDVARDQSGTITATKRTDLVSRLTDTAAERAKNEKPAMHPLDERPMAVSASIDEPAPMPEALRNDLLRGIVMSEILTRPCQRKPAWRRS